MVLRRHLFKDEMDEPSLFGYVELQKKNVFAGRSSHVDHHGLIPRLLSSSTAINTSSAHLQILQNWCNGWHPNWPGFSPNQPWPKEKCKFLHLGRITSTGYQYRWGVDWQSRVLLEMGSQGMPGWIQASSALSSQSRQNTHWALLTGQHMGGLFCSLLKSGEAMFRIQPSFGITSIKGIWRNWNWSTGGMQTGYQENMTLQGGWRKQGLSV